MKAYRVDRRTFKSGDTIKTAGEFRDKHPENGKRAEEVLEARRPQGKPVRFDCLMVFENEACARYHWAKMSGSKLYEVEIDVASILHRADMRRVDAIGNGLNDAHAAERLAIQYWSGDMADRPIIEVLLPNATVSAVISESEQERRAQLKK